ncbi:hypothetical protein ACR3I8_21125 [Priestia flexa]|uniref:hypothetical protein n=1 Tax=Priestia flexa TaxID=86664 RepID=UPI0022049111|nr:hypothetical protein [Priestia flexa]MDT2047645.1 hypothetical protein [Priestia flexa]USY56241.1 hypothetical protein NIZ91_06190 [Bacillus sp. 1780r2a1]
MLAFYETANHTFGVIEFDGHANLKFEKGMEDSIINTLEGKQGNYIGVMRSLEKVPHVKKVNLYGDKGELLDSLELAKNESLNSFQLKKHWIVSIW